MEVLKKKKHFLNKKKKKQFFNQFFQGYAILNLPNVYYLIISLKILKQNPEVIIILHIILFYKFLGIIFSKTNCEIKFVNNTINNSYGTF